MKTYHIRLASFDDVALMLSWAKKENWNPGLNDAFAFQIIDPHGFFIGYLDDKPIACISTVKYQKDYAFLGLYIVSPNYRGQGFGSKIWQHAMDYASSSSSIGLDGVLAQQALYSKLGFQLTHRNMRYSLTKNINHAYTDDHLILANKIPLAEIFDYDQIGFPCKREAFLTAWLLMPNAKSLVYYVNNKIKGYGVVRACSVGYKIGPLFADTAEIARIIFQGLCGTVPHLDQPVFLDIPEPNSHAKKLVEFFSMNPVFETARMYFGNTPSISLDHVFGITTFEMG